VPVRIATWNVWFSDQPGSQRIDRMFARTTRWIPRHIDLLGREPIDDHQTFVSDHFGLEVDEVEPILGRLKKHKVEVVKRPSTRPFAGISTHDPDGNIFDLSQRDMENRTSVYVETEKPAPRHISHFAMRTLHPEKLADFYSDLGLKPAKGKHGNFHLTDGRVTLVLMPWRISDYEGTGIVRAGPDHIGFEVESLDAFKKRLQELGDNNPHLRARMLAGREGEARLKLFASSCSLGELRIADVDGVLLDVAEANSR